MDIAIGIFYFLLTHVGESDCTVGKVLALYVAKTGTIPSILYDPQGCQE